MYLVMAPSSVKKKRTLINLVKLYSLQKRLISLIIKAIIIAHAMKCNILDLSSQIQGRQSY